MKLKSPNVWFIFGTVPVLVLDFVLGAWFARGMVWLSVVLLLLGLLAAVALVRKFIVMPKPRNRYGTPEPFALELPINCNAEFYHCPEMAKYEFLHRTVEVVSPLWNGKKPFQVMINPTLAEKYGQDFEKVAVVRELENFRRKNSLKSRGSACGGGAGSSGFWPAAGSGAGILCAVFCSAFCGGGGFWRLPVSVEPHHFHPGQAIGRFFTWLLFKGASETVYSGN